MVAMFLSAAVERVKPSKVVRCEGAWFKILEATLARRRKPYWGSEAVEFVVFQ